MKSPELTDEAKHAIAGAIRQIASPEPRSWESIAAVICLVGSWGMLNSATTSRLPYLLKHSRVDFTVTFALLAFAAGLGLSAARNQQRRGRLMGTIVFVVSIMMIGGWVWYLVNLNGISVRF